MTQATSIFWLQERLRDFFLWPINLIRDFPTRSQRIIQTLGNGLNGLLTLPADIKEAYKNNSFYQLFRKKTSALIHGFHLLIVQCFDLVGGPEIAQFFMHLITHTTPLTSKEKNLITSILGPQAMRYGDVRIAEGGLMKWVFKMNGRLAFTTWYTINLPQADEAKSDNHTRPNQSLLIHELIHVYQHEKVGTRYMTEAIYVLVMTKRDCYQYGGASGLQAATQQQKSYKQFNREQQAQIVQDYFTRLQKQANIDEYTPFIQQLRDGRV